MWLLKLDGKRLSGFLLLSYITYFGESQLPCCRDTPYVLWQSPATSEDPSPFADRRESGQTWKYFPQPSQTLGWLRAWPASSVQSHEMSRTLSEATPESLIHRNCTEANVCYFKQPNFGVIHYGATHVIHRYSAINGKIFDPNDTKPKQVPNQMAKKLELLMSSSFMFLCVSNKITFSPFYIWRQVKIQNDNAIKLNRSKNFKS